MLVTPTQRTTNNFMNDISILTPTDDSINMYSLLHSKLGSNHNNYFDIEKLKESVCFVKSKDDEPKNEPYKLPDGRIISISSERYKCTEALFNPSFMNLDEKSVTDCIHECIINVDVETRKEMRQNVFAVGGTSSLPGLGTRLQSELLEKNVDFVVGAKTQKYEHWIGGSILASLSTFQSMWVSKCKSSLFCANPKVEYNESGSSVVHRKCF
jgi:actin beta/gamma 1